VAVTRTGETLTLEGMDPVAGELPRLLEVVTAPTGEAVRFRAATMGNGSAWITRAEAETVIEFLQEWPASTAERAGAVGG
jgi:hypothetical protein